MAVRALSAVCAVCLHSNPNSICKQNAAFVIRRASHFVSYFGNTKGDDHSLQARQDMHTNCINLVVTVLSQSVRMNFFANRVINAWNNLPTSVSFTSLPAFSRTIMSVDFRIFLKCNSC